MWHLLLAGLLATNPARETVILRVENGAGCSVRVQVVQLGLVRSTMLVEANRTVTERVRVPSKAEPLSFHITGIGCPFSRYAVEPLNRFESSLVLRLHNVPVLSTLSPHRPVR